MTGPDDGSDDCGPAAFVPRNGHSSNAAAGSSQRPSAALSRG